VDSLDVSARGLTFPCRVTGPEDGRYALLLHGFPEYSLEWAAQLEALGRAGFRAVAPDQRGYAPGNRPAEVDAYRMDELVADVVGLLDALGWARADLIGHDWGGAVAWHVASRHPERLHTLTVLSTPHPLALSKAMRGGPESSGKQREMSSYMGVFRQAGVAEDLLLADDAAALRALYEGIEEADTYVERFQDRAALTGALNWYRAMRREDSERTGVVEVPTLYVWGDRDPAFSREAAEATADFTSPPYTFVPVEGGGHWLPETHAPEVNRLLLRHLAEHHG
jgi:pimeloyl-ACP methyl ester carboxylesterase